MPTYSGAQPDTSDSTLQARIAEFKDEAAALTEEGKLENSYSRLMEWTYKSTEKKVPYLLNGKDFARKFTSRDRDIDEQSANEAKTYFCEQLKSAGVSDTAALAHASTVGVLGQNMVSIASHGMGDPPALGYISNLDSINMATKGNDLEITVSTTGILMDTSPEGDQTCFGKDGHSSSFDNRQDIPPIVRQVILTASFDPANKKSTLAFKEQRSNCDIELTKAIKHDKKELNDILTSAKQATDTAPEKRFGMIKPSIEAHTKKHGLANTWSSIKAAKASLNTHTGSSSKLLQALGRPTTSWKAVMKSMTECACSAGSKSSADKAIIKDIIKEAKQADIKPPQERVIKQNTRPPGTEPEPPSRENSGPRSGV